MKPSKPGRTDHGPAKPDFPNVPDDMLYVPQWLAWWSVVGAGDSVKLPNGRLSKVLKAQTKPHKLPINPNNGSLASTTRPRTWSSCAVACQAVQKWSLTGIGIVFTDSDPYSGVDIDNCRNPETHEIAEWAWEIVRELNSYTELSPSGTGVHILVRGKLPEGKGNQAVYQDGKVEMFSRARYFTFTGDHVSGTPSEVCDRSTELLGLHSRLFSVNKPNVELSSVGPAAHLQSDFELIAAARKARNGAKFCSLWTGTWEQLYTSQSEADLALCTMLAFWTQKDAARVDSIFRQSGLMRDKWDRDGYRERTIATALKVSAECYGLRGRAGRRLRPSEQAADSGASGAEVNIPDLLHFPYTDTGNAERLVCLYGSDIRYCFETETWMFWDGRRWISGEVHRVKQLFKKTIREMHKQAADVNDKDERQKAEKHARRSEAAAAINAALQCAQCEEAIAISASTLDSHPFLLNCENGTLELATGKLRPHNRQDLITKLVHFSYRADTDCPRFLQFLYRMMDGKSGALDRGVRLTKYLQKCFGYALTADVSEKVIFGLFGSGNNGKTTLLETVRFVIKEYSTQILMDTLVAHRTRESLTSSADLADLRGARFATTSETEEGKSLAISKLKYLTQGIGEIKTCRKFENPIAFTAAHKLFIDANHRPVVRGTEKAIWNRLKVIPFDFTIPPDEIDKKLFGKLQREAEGILAWMVEGCRLWQAEGLGDPPEVTEATNVWKEESDRFSAFLNECCLVEPRSWSPVGDLWPAYESWCESNSEISRLMKAAFDARLEELGCKRARRDHGRTRIWAGIRLRTSEDELIPGDKVTRGDSKCG
jgi:putative DNA primase/helicase